MDFLPSYISSSLSSLFFLCLFSSLSFFIIVSPLPFFFLPSCLLFFHLFGLQQQWQNKDPQQFYSMGFFLPPLLLALFFIIASPLLFFFLTLPPVFPFSSFFFSLFSFQWEKKNPRHSYWTGQGKHLCDPDCYSYYNKWFSWLLIICNTRISLIYMKHNVIPCPSDSQLIFMTHTIKQYALCPSSRWESLSTDAADHDAMAECSQNRQAVISWTYFGLVY